MNKKSIIVLSVVIVVMISWGVRVYYVNDGIAKEYDIKTYQVLDNVLFDNATYKVIDFRYGAIEEDDSKTIPLTIEMEVQNTSDKSIAISRIIETKLAYGLDFYQTRDGDFDIYELKNLPPKTTTNIKLTYQVKPKYNGKEAKLYIPQDLYGEQVMDKYQTGKRYGIVIQL
ncbi:hypothetical protein NC797_14880 [Aquibacillus sp. 3ASR75-11]|uniref:DUF4352 domain-containing protein n=1 Tax=Terrihalobacillus insolitus TaxID=2950438 RepID=A0A9X3WUF1_9BACI|nr:hypothetical protein [Terrihalobacillus insolitus]MDC3414314.1 hypothetical protein [Terrihalobacillus insolitus]MDC3425790.1 hypothetical protein [Terrihalobacillus insolitus]